jgi:chitinase
MQGPNSPLYDGPKGERISVDSSLSQWHAAGIPYKQLAVGAAFYGWTARTTSTSTNSQYVSFSKIQIQGDQYDTISADPCPGSPKSYSGEMQWRSIASEVIDRNKNGWKTEFDSTTRTPYSTNSRKRQIVTYDNG